MEIKIYSKTHGEKKVLVDEEDYELIKNYNWYIAKTSGSKFYVKAHSHVEKNKRIFVHMHRLIMNSPECKSVDHINGDTLDNRKNNLRVCEHMENMRNQGKRKNGKTSKYKGVNFHKNMNKFCASIRQNYKLYHLGYFKNEIEAARAYNAAALKYHGEYAYLNAV